MTARSALWAVAFCLPVAVAVGFSISLHRKRAELLATIDQLNASLGRHRDTLKAASAENKDRLDRMAAFREQVKRIDDSLPPWQRRLQAVRLAWADLIRQGRAGAVMTAPVVQFSAKQPYFLQLMGDPAYAKAVEALMRQQVEGDYGRFLASDNLSPQAQDQLLGLLTQLYMDRLDSDSLMGTGSDPTERTAVRAQADAEVRSEIRSDFGTPFANALHAYNQNMAFYGMTDQMADRLAGTSTPLEPAQADQLVGLLDQTLGPVAGRARWMVPSTVVDQSQAFLSAPQTSVLLKIQQEQAVTVGSALAQRQAAR
jgi:hypothetical protein